MRFVSLNVLTPFLFLICFAGGAWAAEDVSWTDRFSNELKEIREKLDNVEKQQREILSKEDKILEELNRVRIWVHKR